MHYGYVIYWSYIEQEALGMMWVSMASMEGFDFSFWVRFVHICLII